MGAAAGPRTADLGRCRGRDAASGEAGVTLLSAGRVVGEGSCGPHGTRPAVHSPQDRRGFFSVSRARRSCWRDIETRGDTWLEPYFENVTLEQVVVRGTGMTTQGPVGRLLQGRASGMAACQAKTAHLVTTA